MDTLFKNMSQKIRVYLSVETETDPFEKNVSHSLLNPIPIPAIVTDLIGSQSQWKMPGIITDKAKALIIRKRHKTLIEKSQKIEIDGVDYNGWKINGKLQIRDDGDYTRIYCYAKQV